MSVSPSPHSLTLPPLGAHVSTAGGVDTAVDRAEQEGFSALQIFPQSPRTWRPTVHPDERLERFRLRRREAGVVYVAVHAIYLINLAAKDEEQRAKATASLLNAVEVAVSLEADGVVVHVGSHGGEGLSLGLKRCRGPLREALARCQGPTHLLIENAAGGGGKLGRDVAELAALLDCVGYDERAAVCLDSCHLYASGVDVGDEEVVANLAADLEAEIGLTRLKLLHVNDSRDPLGSRRDRHALVGEGVLGERLQAFVNHPALRALPAVVENEGRTGKGADRQQGEALRALYSPA